MAYTPLMRGDSGLEEAVRSLDLGSKPQADTICSALMTLARRRRNGSGADGAEQDDRTVVAFVVEDAAA